jgi:hypothetical protein
MADVLQTELVIKNGSDEYTFRIPSPRDYGKMNVRARALRMVDDRDGASEFGLDPFTVSLYRGLALFEVLLLRASVQWPWVQTEKGLVIDSSNFPSAAIRTVVEVYDQFDSELARFLYPRTGNAEQDGAAPVESQPNT